MVFESIVVDVLNRFLGSYVENLNRSQLKLGIWGGDVVLENLVLKQNALEELDIPVQTVYGHLGKLVLKIPWKNLYGASVEATIDRLFLVINPLAEVKYDAEREEKAELAAKQAELARIEEQKKKEAQKDATKLDETFVEKLVTQIIKNVQLKITSIHIRYEDSVTNPKKPFSLGVTLYNLSVHTTDENWKQTVIQESVTKIFKILDLEGLAIYWNPAADLYAKYEPAEIQRKLQGEIATKSFRPPEYDYALGPINATAKLKLNPKPEADTVKFSIPKVILDLHMETLSVSLTKMQYRDMMLLADSMDRMNRGLPYRKYRPQLNSYKGHYRIWWKFAYTCILEEEVRRRRRNWQWKHMKAHKDLCRAYAVAYRAKLSNKGKVTPEVQIVLDNGEKTLDLFNLVITRQQIEMEVERLDKKEEEAKKTRGWFSGWWSGSTSKEEESMEGYDIVSFCGQFRPWPWRWDKNVFNGKNIAVNFPVKQFEKAMTPEEKNKLFRAIDYQENSAPLHLPMEYVAMESNFKLDSLTLCVTNGEVEVLKASVNNVLVCMLQRPSASAIKVEAQMQSFTVTGVQQEEGNFIPQLVMSKEVSRDVNLINVIFETNPLDGTCDQRVKVSARPLQMVYDAETVIEIVNVFKPPTESTALTTLQEVAGTKLSEMKEKSALGMQYALMQRNYVDIDVDIAASYIIIAKTGKYKGNEPCAVVKLGAITVKSKQRSRSLDVHRMYKEGHDDEGIFREIFKHSYDTFYLGLTEMQVVVALESEDWTHTIGANTASHLHLLEPTTLMIKIKKCVLTDDPRLPKIRVVGELQKIAFSISEDRLLTLCEILVSMPLPQSEENYALRILAAKIACICTEDPNSIRYFQEMIKKLEIECKQFIALEFIPIYPMVKKEPDKEKDIKERTSPNTRSSWALTTTESRSSSISLLKYLDPAEKTRRESQRMLRDKRAADEQSVQLTELEAYFIMKELVVSINHKRFDDEGQRYHKFLVFSLVSLELTVTQKTFTLESVLQLGSVGMCHYRSGHQVINMIETPHVAPKTELADVQEISSKYLFTIRYCNVNKKCPEFRSYFGSVEQLIQLDFTSLRVLLHLEGLKEILVVVNDIQTRVQTIQQSVDRIASAGPLETIMEDQEMASLKSRVTAALPKTAGPKQVESIQLKVNAKVGAIEIEFATNTRPLSVIKLQGASAGLVLKASYTQADCSIGAITVTDLNSDSLHKEILKVLGGDVITVQVIMYNLENFPQASDVDMSIDAQINCLRIVYLNWFVSSMLEFLDNFQEAQNAIIEASSQAAETARANVHNVYQNSTKISMKVRFAAPIIIVPENSRSMNALLLDFGRMNLNNKFVDTKIKNVQKPVTVDELKLEMEEVKICCVTLHLERGNYELTNERKLLRPTSFTVFVKRNLSMWYDLLPDLDVSGRMNTMAITVGHNEYKSIMKILNQNLQEGQKGKEVKKVEAPKAKTQSKSVATIATTKAQVRPSVGSESDDPEQEKQPKTTVKFSFTMDNFVIDLLSSSEFGGDSELARFCLALLSLKGRMYSDGTMHTSMLLVDCTLDDMRPGRGTKITRYLERRRSKSMESVPVESRPTNDKVRSMIDITYTLKNNDTFIDMRIFSFNLILAMDFMNKLADFVTTGLAPEPKVREERKTLDKATPASNITLDQQSKKKPTVSEHSMPVDSQPASMMTVNIKIEQPDIILVESLEERQCDALVLNMEARFKLRQTEERMVADGGISGLQMVVRTLGGGDGGGGEGRAPRYLLAPANLSLAVAQPPAAGMHVDIAISAITITVSPGILALLNRVMATMTSTEEDATVHENKAIYYSEVWKIKPFKATDYWFLSADEAEEAVEEIAISTADKPPVGEICLLSSPSITVSFEMEVGHETIPMLVMQASLSGRLKDWSSDFYLESTWAMQVSYYNISRAVWEPLIEPVEVMRDAQYKHEPWELKMEVVMRSEEAAPSRMTIDVTDEAANLQAVAQRHANKIVTISSSEPLEITITRTGMEVLTLLSNSFSGDVSSEQTIGAVSMNKKAKKYEGAPYVLHNCTGLTVKLNLNDNVDFTVHLTSSVTDVSNYKEVVLEPGASVPLQLRHGGFALLRLNEPPPQLKLNVKIVEMSEELSIPVERADKRYFPIGKNYTSPTLDRHIPHVAAIEPRGLISDIAMKDAAMHIYLRSVVQVTNDLSVNVSVYYMTQSGNEVRLLGDVHPGDVLRLPLQAVHTPTAEIFFSVEGFTVSISPFVWRELQQHVKIAKLLQCDSKDKRSGEKFYLKAVGKMEQVFYEHSNKHTFASSCYYITLRPAVRLQNCLPVPIEVSQLGLKRTQLFQPGEMFHLSHLAPNKASIVIVIKNYLEKCWVCTKNLPDELTEFSVWTFESHDSPALMTLDLGMHNADLEGSQGLSLYCPFWMLNKTGFTLCYRKSKKNDNGTPTKNAEETGNVIFHPADYHEPILFSFRAKNFFEKKKASIRIEFGEWCERFSLDVPGSSGVLTCKNSDVVYQVAVTNQLTFNSLTKMVIFTPYYLIINEAPFPIQYQELTRSADPWQTVSENSSAPLWPKVEREEKLLVLRAAGSTDTTAPFIYTEQRTDCLKLPNEYGGIHVEVQSSEGGTYITLRQYHDGHAPALLVNFTPHPVAVLEKENVNVKNIPSMHQMMFSWDNPAGPQVLMFEGHKRKEVENDLRKDGIGDYMIDETHRIYWVSFLDGLQRVILFTTDAILASSAYSIGEAEKIDTEIVFSMQGMGVSLVNDQEMQEIVYISISHSGIIWEQCKIGGRRYKKIEGHKFVQYEEAYQHYVNKKLVSDVEVSPIVKIDDKIEVDFEEMRVLKPSPRLLRRTLEPGLWASYGMSQHSVRVHARLHRLQVDQQLPLPTFPVVLAPVPPPRSIATESGIKPFLEVSIVERIMEQSKVRQYKYYKVLIQEFHVKVDMGLINALMNMFPSRMLTDEEALNAFEQDMERAMQPLDAVAALGVASDLKNFYDNLHLSPLKVHVSFSLGGATTLPTFIGTVLQSIGVTLTDMNDVVIKLSYYERNYEFLSQKELISQVQSHYTGQALKQLYVLVLGLDVLGNPYGLVIGLKKGVEDLFYEPYKGAIQGPGEFAEGLFLGVRSLVGHTVGGAAGAVSRITGAMGHGLAALSLDKDYQRRRRDNINKPPANLQEGIARSGKGLVMGVVDGVTGVVVRPLQGAQQAGAPGFVKGLGRGAIGLVVRPIGGVVDFTYGLLSSVKRAADFSEEVTKRRAARYLPPETGVRPYSRLKAEGYKMLFELEKGKYLTTDSYEAHVWVIPAKEVVMCTDKRILYLEKNTVFGGWQIVWSYLWSEIPEVPTSVPNGVYIPTAKRKVLGMFPASGSGKVIFLYDEQQKKYLLAQCAKLMSNR